MHVHVHVLLMEPISISHPTEYFFVPGRYQVRTTVQYPLTMAPLTTKQKHAYCLEYHRTVYPRVCLEYEVAPTLEVIHENEKGEGVCESFYSSEENMVDWWHKLGSFGQLKPTKNRKKNRQQILDKCIQTEKEDGNGMTRVYIADDVRLRLVEVFFSYKAAVDVSYNFAKAMTEIMEIKEGSITGAPMNHELDRIVRESAADSLRTRQNVGAAPTHYVNGVPNYRGSSANAFRF